MNSERTPSSAAAGVDLLSGFAGLARQAAALADGEIGSSQLVEHVLGRIAETEPELNAFRVVLADDALAAAADADRRLAAGERAPLLGVPVAIKDDTDIAGESTNFGCPGDFPVAQRDSAVVMRLREAGAIVVGKTNTSEVGQWPVTATPTFGVTRNPWNLERTPGGSSGGAAATVAAGVLPATVGSDGAGSVRIPAAWNHLVGIKPQRGRISTFPDPESFNGIAVNGPLARTVGDAALLLDVLTGSQPEDLWKPPAPAEPYAIAAQRDPGRLRIALSFRIPFSGTPARLGHAVRARVERLAEVLASLGHDVVEADPAYRLIGAGFMPRSLGGVNDWTRRVPDRAQLDHRTLENARNGRLLSPLLPLARGLEGIDRRRIGRIFHDFDVVLTPTTAKPAPPANSLEGLSAWDTDKAIVGACPYAWPWNVLGWPGVNVPAGFTDQGLPVGAQLLGQADSEPKLIALAAQLEQAERWHERRPERFDT